MSHPRTWLVPLDHMPATSFNYRSRSAAGSITPSARLRFRDGRLETGFLLRRPLQACSIHLLDLSEWVDGNPVRRNVRDIVRVV
jgi:hypothetical protein